MKRSHLARRRPYLFSFLIVMLLLLVNGSGVVIARQVGLSPTALALYTELLLTAVLIVIVSKLRWWEKIGFRKADRPAQLWLFVPSLALFIGNLTFGVYVTQPGALLSFALLAATSGFVEEVIFRGLILHSLLPRGRWTAVLVTTAIFGFAHAGNALAGAHAVAVIVQVAYALAIGFGFAAMVVKGRLIWPLIVAHGLGNFVAFINNDVSRAANSAAVPVDAHTLIVSVAYIVLFTSYGLYLMRKRTNSG